MKLQSVTAEDLNYLYRKTKLQLILEEFQKSDQLAMKVELEPGEYASLHSAQGSLSIAIKKHHFGMAARILNNELYLIKITPSKPKTGITLDEEEYTAVLHHLSMAEKELSGEDIAAYDHLVSIRRLLTGEVQDEI